MQQILDTLRAIGYKYDKLKEKDDFNLFTILRNSSDEVNLHSQFLYTLLNPEGSHHEGRKFLDEFLRIFEVGNFENQEVKVYKEYKNIDILIKNAKKAVIIENKIWAGDQDKQLQRYYETIESEGVTDIKIIYLSPYAETEPSEKSIGTLKDLPRFEDILFCGSYEHEIYTWMDECIKIVALHPVMRETFVQYQKLINELIGNTVIMEERLEIIELLRQNDNILQAHKIATNWIHVKWHTEWDFWKAFESLIANEYKISEQNKYSAASLTSAIHRKRGGNRCYGLLFEIAKADEGNFCIYIERGDEDIYYGLTLDCEGVIQYTEKLNHISTEIEEYSEWKHSEYWLGGNYLEPKVNFEQFANETTLKLLNPDYRTQFLHGSWGKIKEFIEICKNIIDVFPK